jgi:glucose-6-phosphate 1-dehydrogenase
LISPEILFSLGRNVLDPDEHNPGQSVEMVTCRQQSTDEPSAYERVLGDAMKVDVTLFARQDYAEEAWCIIDPVLKEDTPVHEYEPKTLGSNEVDKSVSPDGGRHMTQSKRINPKGRRSHEY